MSRRKPQDQSSKTPIAEEQLAETPQPQETLTAETVEESSEVSVEKLVEAMATFKAEAEKNLDGWQRERAEFQNYKRRVEREQKEYYRRAELDAMAKIFPIVDDFERALANIPADLQDNAWVNGTALILNKFKKLFDELEISPIAPENEPFDPYLHQAIVREDSDAVESGHVITTLQKGYKSGDTVLRPALVRVAN